MYKTLFLLFFFLNLNLTASVYTSDATVVASTKDSACKKALNEARGDALAQAGTLVISDYNSQSTQKDKSFTQLETNAFQNISVGVVKLLSKKESIDVTKEYLFKCSVEAEFSIDKDKVKKAIDTYLTKKEQHKDSISIISTGYSEEGQSRYRAIKSAQLDAKRTLLDKIKGSKFFSTLEAQDGNLVADRVINGLNGHIRYVQTLSEKYDAKTGSAVVKVGMTQEALEANINSYRGANDE